MNIKEAKEEIKNAMTAYFTKNEFGEYRIPVEKQRPVFLMGPPGIGKTAIMEQIAQELDVGIISYSMTHHTRQSALGLPYIETKVYGGKEYSVSEYTMSEIIASVYDLMEETGKKEGILFLDEINCVSETLAPSMLQFLQYKVFGKHRVPEGWIVVTAGNPPEYNNSVREFDIVTWDRLKRIDVEPDFAAWKEFALRSGVHGAITTYLDIKKEDFYRIETTLDGKSFVTARGWSDLSEMILLYEENGLKVTEKLIGQYLQDKRIAKDFAVYYDLYRKYLSDYQVDQILDGKEAEHIRTRAGQARFDERLSLLGLLLDEMTGHLKQVYLEEKIQEALLDILKKTRPALTGSRGQSAASGGFEPLLDTLARQTEACRTRLDKGQTAGSLSVEERATLHAVIRHLEADRALLQKENPADAKTAFALLKRGFDQRAKALKKQAASAGKKLSNLFAFCEAVYGDGQEMVILVTELTVSFYSAHFISRYGCPEYTEHNKSLLFYERQKDILAQLDDPALTEDTASDPEAEDMSDLLPDKPAIPDFYGS